MGFEEQEREDERERGDFIDGEEDGDDDRDVTVFAGGGVRDSDRRGSNIRDSHDNDEGDDRDEDMDEDEDGYHDDDNENGNGYSNRDREGDVNGDGYGDGDGDGDENGSAPSPFSRTIGDDNDNDDEDDGGSERERERGMGDRIAPPSISPSNVVASSSSSSVDLWPDYCNPSYRMPSTIDVRIEADPDKGGGGEYFIQVHVVKAVPGSKIYLGGQLG